jgi:hypothetical protein
MKHIFLAVIIFGLMLISCGRKIVTPEVEHYRFPVSIGNTWTYRQITSWGDALTDTNFIVTTIENSEILSTGEIVYDFFDSIYIPGTDTLQADTAHSYFLDTDSGLYLYASKPGWTPSLWKKSSRTLGPGFSVRDHPAIMVPYRLSPHQIWVDTVYHDSSVVAMCRTFEGYKTVITPAGTFVCMKISTAGYIGESRIHYFGAEGLIRKEKTTLIENCMWTDSLSSGPMEYVCEGEAEFKIILELVSYDLK